MKTNLKKAALLITAILAGGSVFAQTNDVVTSADYVQPFSSTDSYRTWSIGVNAGILTPYTIFRGNKEDFTYHGTDLGYSVYIKNQISPAFGIQANFLKGHLSGAAAQDPAFSSFKTDLKYGFDLRTNYTFANISWKNQKSAIQTYVSSGVGLMGYTPSFVTSSNGSTFVVDHTIKSVYIPLGVGVKFNLSPMVNLDLGYDVNFVNADNVDGFNYGSSNDKFSYGHVGLEFALGNHSKPQMATHNPVSSMRHEYLTQDQALQTQLDAEKHKNDQLRDELNASKNNMDAALAKLTTDSDGDGVSDFFDKCPGTPMGTKVDGSGCALPVVVTPKPDVRVYVTDEDKKVVNEAIKNLEFDFGKATLRPRSFPSLDRVAELLINKNFSLKLAGHTDNVGSNDANLKLSKERAESVKSYLVSKGANPSRIEATGYGETQPIATNKTARGRQMNRRVEFTLY